MSRHPLYHGPFIVKSSPGRLIKMSILVNDIKIFVTMSLNFVPRPVLSIICDLHSTKYKVDCSPVYFIAGEQCIGISSLFDDTTVKYACKISVITQFSRYVNVPDGQEYKNVRISTHICV